MPRPSLLLLALLLLAPGRAAATTLADVCSGDPCVLRTTVNVTAGTGTLDFGEREFRIAGTGALHIPGGERLLMRARTIVLEAGALIAHTGASVRGASLLLEASGDILLEKNTAGRSIDLSAEMQGGSIDIDAGGDVRISGEIRADAMSGFGGDVLLTAGKRLMVDGPVAASGGEAGGSIELVGESLVSATATLDASGSAPGADGGEVSVDATGDVILDAPVLVSGPGGFPSDIVSGGDVTVTATNGTILIRGGVTAFGGGQDGQGGTVELDAGQLVMLTAPIDVQARLGGGGSVSVFAAEIHAEAEINGDGLDGGSDLTLTTRLGNVVRGAVVMRGDLHVFGDGGSITVQGCVVEVGATARLAAASQNLLEASGQMTIAGMLVSARDGRNDLRYRDAALVPVFLDGSTVNPPPVQQQVATLPACTRPGVCGNNVHESGEGCDRGAENGGPGVGCDTSCRVCSLGGDPGCPCAEDLDCGGPRCAGFACVEGVCTSVEPQECDDHDACNGQESCDPSVGCVRGPEPTCDDADACTEDTCDDPVVGCQNTLPPGFAGLTCRVNALADEVNGASRADLKGGVRRKVRKVVAAVRTRARRAEATAKAARALRLLDGARAQLGKLRTVVAKARARNKIGGELADRLEQAAGQATVALDAVARSISPGT